VNDILLIPPAAYPVSVSEAKAQSRITTNAEDSLVQIYIEAATEQVETILSRSIINQKRRTVLDCFYSTITPPNSPLLEVDSIRYINQNEVETLVDVAVYDVAKEGERGRITPKDGQNWPLAESRPNSVQVDYYAGYSTPFTADVQNNRLAVQKTGAKVGDSIYLWNSGGALPAGLVQGSYTITEVTATYIELQGVTITTAGTGTHFAGFLPAPIRQAIQWLAGHLYENRSASTIADVKTLPMGLESILAPFRVVRF